MKYVIDTSSLLEGAIGRRYEKEFFPIHWNNLNNKIDSGLIVSTMLVYKELEKKDDGIFNWANLKKYMFKIPSVESQIEITNLFATFPEWGENINKNPTWADPELIAFSKAHDLILVTQEKCNINATEEKNYKIPTICNKYGVECVNFLELIKRENLHE